jgi:DNA polymerase-3 subunit delta
LRDLQNPAGQRRVWDTLLNDPGMTDGDMVFPISALLIREARQLWQLFHGEESKVQLYPAMKSRKQQLARQLGPVRIARLWDFALKADTDIKTGRLRPAQALENLVRDVSRLSGC